MKRCAIARVGAWLKGIKLVSQLSQLSRQWKQSVLVSLDMISVPVAVILALIIRWGGLHFSLSVGDVLGIVVTSIVTAVIFLRIGLYRAVVRYMGADAILTIVQGVTLSALVLSLTMMLARSGMPRSTPFIYWGLMMVAVGGCRLVVRTLYHNAWRGLGENVIIYGAGHSGRELLPVLFNRGNFSPVAFIDDDPAMRGTIIHGVRVYGADSLEKLVSQFEVKQVLLAMPSVDRKRRVGVIEMLEQFPVHVKTVPDVGELMAGTADVGELRDIDIEDLLGRQAVPPRPELLSASVLGKVVMVTGAGGSIGSELCRQIVKGQPDTLLLFDSSEYALYQISEELQRSIAVLPNVPRVVTLIGSVQNQQHLQAICQQFNVQTIYHAAAYKHVPIVENNISEGVRNNVFGTVAAARAAIAAKVETFVLVSSDKAVRPTNFMGASKRFAELVLQAYAVDSRYTKFSMVRFGNVLGSSGSVVPLFQDQVRRGGPVTVTHPDVVRYFMTIPEAAQLVLQAGGMAKGGDVFLLDMGEPVRIIDLAHRIIRLMGHNVNVSGHDDKAMEVVYTGLRPGEKLYEELLLGEGGSPTEHPMIMRAQEEFLRLDELEPLLAALNQSCSQNDCEKTRTILMSAVKGFQSKDGISDAIWRQCGCEVLSDYRVS
jgi:FlaA1/EpsC-like NDP-sugar epimerase